MTTHPGIKFPAGRGSSKSLAIFRKEEAERRAKSNPHKGYPKEGKLTPQEALEYRRTDPMVCLLCGRSYQLLGSHITRSHKIRVEDYCERYGIPFRWGREETNGQGLATPRHRLRMRESILAVEGHVDRVRQMGKDAPHGLRAAHWPEAYKAARVSVSKTAPRDCPVCGSSFRPKHSWVTFCSKKCSGISRRGKATRPTNPPQPCVNCGEAHKPSRKGRCNRCYRYLVREGTEWPTQSLAPKG